MELETIDETAKRLRRSRSSVYNDLAAGHYKAVKMSGRVFVLADTVNTFLASLPTVTIKPRPSKRAA